MLTALSFLFNKKHLLGEKLVGGSLVERNDELRRLFASKLFVSVRSELENKVLSLSFSSTSDGGRESKFFITTFDDRGTEEHLVACGFAGLVEEGSLLDSFSNWGAILGFTDGGGRLSACVVVGETRLFVESKAALSLCWSVCT